MNTCLCVCVCVCMYVCAVDVESLIAVAAETGEEMPMCLCMSVYMCGLNRCLCAYV